MNALILAAGYATRLYPLTLTKAKPLLEVAGKPMIEWVTDQLVSIPSLKRIYIVTNDKFAADFIAWTQSYTPKEVLSSESAAKGNSVEFVVVNDGSKSDADKLGAIGDIHYVLENKQIYKDDLLVIAGDNLLSEPLTDFVNFANQHPATLGVYDVKSLDEAKKYNQLTTNPAGILTAFEEKPANPTSTICGIALYYYKPEALKLIHTYIAEGNNPDQPGRFVQWIHSRLDVFTYPIRGTWYDIGSHETLAEAGKIFSKLG
jgi:glucose-1-phosphate thymidylyltransferase